ESFETTEWPTPIPHLLDALQVPGRHLVVGDFSLHHPLWGGPEVTRSHAAAELLIRGMIANQMDLLLTPGTITREKHNNEPSTLDLTLSTSNLTPHIMACQIVNDHRPIGTIIRTGSQVQKNSPLRRSFRRTNAEAARDGAKWLQIPANLSTPEEVDQYVDYLVQFIQDLMDQTVPYSKLSTRRKP